MLHPTRNQLEKFANGASSDTAIARHVEECEFCRELVERQRTRASSNSDLESTSALPALHGQAEACFSAALRGRRIALQLLTREARQTPGLLAADPPPATQPETAAVATFFSERPEVVLRLVHDGRAGTDHVQVIADDAALFDHVLVCNPPQQWEFLTDAVGRAQVDGPTLVNPRASDWELRLPEAVLELSEFVAELPASGGSGETILKTERGDGIEVKIEAQSGAWILSAELLTLDGSRQFAPARFYLTTGSMVQTEAAVTGQPARFALPSSKAPTTLRLFR